MPDPGSPPKVVLVPPPVPAATHDWRRLHLWQIQPVRDLLLIAVVFGILWLGYKLSIITVPILLALLLAYLFEPVVRRLTRTRFFSRPGAALAIILAGALLVGVPLVIGAAFAVAQGAGLARNIAANTTRLVAVVQSDAALAADEQALPSNPDYQKLDSEAWRALARRIARERRKIAEAQREHKPLPGYKQDLYVAIENGLQWVQANSETVAKAVGQRAIAGGADAVRAALAILKSLAVLTFSGFLTAFFFFFFSTGYGKVIAFWQSLIPERRKGRVIELTLKMDRVISGFIRGRLTICGVLAVFYSIGYAVIGVPAPLIVGPLVGILSIAPYVPLVGVPLSIILLALDSGGTISWYWIVFAPIVVYMLGQALDDYVLSPIIQGKTTDMDTPSILFATIAGGALAGFYGVLLAIPVAACIKILLKEVVWPRFGAWAAGRARDPLPISTAGPPAEPPPD